MSHPEALLNELKGSLFEYLVARQIACSFDREGEFLLSLSDDYQKLLEQQDLMVREIAPKLPQLLSVWSLQTAHKFLETKSLTFIEFRLSGQFSHLKELGECDIELKTSESIIPVSLKLNKKQGMVNTKSAGVKSFYQHYFSDATHLQQRFNLLVENEHSLLRDQLYELMELDADHSSWQEWKNKGFSELPGEQPAAIKEVLHRYYARLAQKLQTDLEEIYQADPQKFKGGLLKLLGFAHQDLVQLICFHDWQSSHPEVCEVHIFDAYRGMSELEVIQFRENKETASVEIQLKNWLLQIRIKPMNKFTTTAIKINCSVKY